MLADDEFTVRTAASVPETTAIPDLDCLVSEPSVATGDQDGHLDRLRRHEPTLPVVFLLEKIDQSPTVDDRRWTSQWVDWHAKGASTVAVERLGERIGALVEKRRLATRVRRSLASLALADEPIAIVDADGALEFANHSFAMQFGYDRDQLAGRAWQSLFTDDSARRLQQTAVPTVADGWRWTGTCTGRRASGSTFPVSVHLDGSADGGLVIVTDSAGAEFPT